MEVAELDKDGNVGVWKLVDTPKEGTTDMSTQEGSNTEYTEEGGGLVDRYQQKSKYTLKIDLFAKKGMSKPIPDDNGVITKNYAIRVTPEDPECLGFVMWKCAVSCLSSYKVADGIIWQYSFAGLLNDVSSQIMDDYVKATSLDFDKNYIVFTRAADSEGQTVTPVVGAGTTIIAESSEEWATATVSEGAVTVTVTANATGKKRIAWVTVSADVDTSEDDKESVGKFKVIQSK